MMRSQALKYSVGSFSRAGANVFYPTALPITLPPDTGSSVAAFVEPSKDWNQVLQNNTPNQVSRPKSGMLDLELLG